MAKKKAQTGKPAAQGKRGDQPEAPAPLSGEDLAEAATAPKADHVAIEDQLKELTPEQADMFVRIIEITMKRRRVMLIGYLSALCALVTGVVWALYMYGTHERGTFIGWVFMVPLASAALLIWFFGRWSKRIE
jgi:hypothetical protein